MTEHLRRPKVERHGPVEDTLRRSTVADGVVDGISRAEAELGAAA